MREARKSLETPAAPFPRGRARGHGLLRAQLRYTQCSSAAIKLTCSWLCCSWGDGRVVGSQRRRKLVPKVNAREYTLDKRPPI